MPHESQAHSARFAPARAHFVTDLTPEQCRAVFERATIYEHIGITWHDAQRFTLERRAAIALGIAIPLHFAGSLTATTRGTRVTGRVTPDSMQRIARALRASNTGWSIVAVVLVFAFLLSEVLGTTSPDAGVLVISAVIALAFLSFFTHQKIEFLPMALVYWLDDRLHPPPDLVPEVADPGLHDHAPPG